MMQFVNPMKGAKLYRYPHGNITQLFGENPQLYSGIPGLLIKAHNGWDIALPYGTPVMAVCDGYVADIKDSPNGYGRHIRLISKKQDDNYYYEITFGHLSEIKIRMGDSVRAGDVIGACGNSGFVVTGAVAYWRGYNPDHRGTHLHATIRRLRDYVPGEAIFKYPNDSRYYHIMNYDNGFAGAIDPVDFFEDEIKQQAMTVIEMVKAYLAKVVKQFSLIK